MPYSLHTRIAFRRFIQILDDYRRQSAFIRGGMQIVELRGKKWKVSFLKEEEVLCEYRILPLYLR